MERYTTILALRRATPIGDLENLTFEVILKYGMLWEAENKREASEIAKLRRK